jgi:hypothetical protein
LAQNHLVVPDTVQCRISIADTQAGDLNIVTHGLIPTALTVDVNLADALNTSLSTLWANHLAAYCQPSTVFGSVHLRDLRQPNLPEIPSNNAGAPGSGVAGDILPHSLAAVCTVRTGKAGRSYRGRMYWGGFMETANGTAGHMTPAFKAAMDAFAAGWISAFNIQGLQFGVTHRPTIFDPDTGLPIAPGLGFTTPAIIVECRDDVWDSQRRRNQ